MFPLSTCAELFPVVGSYRRPSGSTHLLPIFMEGFLPYLVLLPILRAMFPKASNIGSPEAEQYVDMPFNQPRFHPKMAYEQEQNYVFLGKSA